MPINAPRDLAGPVRLEANGDFDRPGGETIQEIPREPSDPYLAQLDRLRVAIGIADAQIARGEVIDWTPGFMDRLMREAAENVRAGKPIKDEVQP